MKISATAESDASGPQVAAMPEMIRKMVAFGADVGIKPANELRRH